MTLSRADFLEIATLHRQGIKQGFLSSLGEPFLVLMYQAIERSEKSVLIVHRQDGEIAGFASATLNMKSIYREMFKCKRALLAALFPAVFSIEKIKRILEVIFYKKKGASISRSFPGELLSIAVKEKYKGKKIANQLFGQIADYFSAAGASGFRIVVGAKLIEAQKFYRKIGAYPVEEISVHDSDKSLVYLFNLKDERHAAG